jgi:homoserine kinase type II
MAVFTQVAAPEAQALLHELDLGELHKLCGIESGIENTNYFVSTSGGEFVLTLFERLRPDQLPFYLQLMQHLARRGLAVPEPASNRQGELLHRLCGKPAALVNRLPGKPLQTPAPSHCAALGEVLARMHLAARDYPLSQPNLRGLAWWNDTAPLVLPHLEADQAALLKGELAYANHIAQGSAYTADMFRDNVLFEGEALTGVFDFYFAGVDSWLFDLAVCLNDWCVESSSAAHDPARTNALLQGYTRVRPLVQVERRLLPALLRAAALRFWISRLWDFYLPRRAALLKPLDPTHFERTPENALHCPTRHWGKFVTCLAAGVDPSTDAALPKLTLPNNTP